MNSSVVSASAGSGKTYRLTEILYERTAAGRVNPEEVIAVTFTRAAAGELGERVRSKLFEMNKPDAGHAIQGALIGTVHSVCERLLRRFALEAGLPPGFDVLPEEDTDIVFAQALSNALTTERHAVLTEVGHRFQAEDPRLDIRRVADAARSNAIPADQLQEMADDSAASLLAVLDKPYWATAEAADEACLEVLDRTVAALRAHVGAGEDTTKKTLGTLEFLERFKSALANGGAQWKDWAKIDPPGTGKKSEALVEDLAEIGSKQLGHPRLHEDVEQYIRTVFATAADALSLYAEWKGTRRLIDFTDMEALTLELLKDEVVASVVGEEFKLLLFDEFQDTNPIQLALFNRLGEVAGEVVWVGDRKQSIFGFRGSDPDLMESAYRAQLGGEDPEILETSYRSRPRLVEFCNQIFEKTFGDKKTVHLKANRKEKTELSEAVECWILESKNLDTDAQLLAEGVRQLLDPDDPAMVEDPVSGIVRPATAGDIAVLRRTNARCAAIAGNLSQIGIPASVAENGLTQTLEITYLLSALEIALDGYSSLAAAKLVHLYQGGDAVDLLEDRMRGLADEDAGRIDPWSDHEVIGKLLGMSDEADIVSPAMLLDRVVEVSEVRELCVRWGNGAVRLGNVEKTRGFATQYEAHCALYSIGATGGGLLSYFQSLDDGGEQAADVSSDAVHVTTYHKAKGKEWPIVIQGDLDPQLPLWCASMGIEVHSGESEFDPADPLKGRQIRFWPWPYGLTTTGAPLHGRVQNTEEERDAKTKQDHEAQRLLYVGFTRARDVLVLPTRVSQPKPRLIENLEAELSFPVGGDAGIRVLELISGIDTRGRVRRIGIGDTGPFNGAAAGRFWFETPEPSVPERLPMYAAASQYEGEPSTVTDVVELGARLGVKASSESETALGDAFHAFLAADDRDALTPGERRTVAVRYCSAYGLGGAKRPDAMVAAADRLLENLYDEIEPIRIDKELPVLVRRDGQILRGVLDLLAYGASDAVLVDHKTFLGPRDLAVERARVEFGPQIRIYREAIERSETANLRRSAVHLPFSSLLVGIKD